MAHPTIINRDLPATCWTSAGDAAPSRGDETSPVDLPTRIETAAEIGREGFGLLHTDLAIAANTIGLQELRRIFEGAGIKHVELEFLPWWWTTDERRRISDDTGATGAWRSSPSSTGSSPSARGSPAPAQPPCRR